MSSSPDIFKPFNPDLRRETGGLETLLAESAVPAFKVADALWTTLTTDPLLKGELDRLIDARVGSEIRARVQAGEAALRQQTVEEAREIGLAEARAQTQLEAQALRVEVESVCRSVVELSQRQLNDHEALWIRSLSLLMKRFLVPNDAGIVTRIQRWLKESIEELVDRGEVRVFLSPVQFGRLSASLDSTGEGWAWQADAALADGELRCETNRGGVIFSPGEQWDRLEKVVQEIVGEAGREASKL